MKISVVVVVSALLVACGGDAPKREAPEEPEKGDVGGVSFEVDPGTGEAALTAVVVEAGGQLWLAIKPDNLPGPMAGAQFEVEIAEGVEVGEAVTDTPLMVFHKIEGRRHRFVLFSYTGATMNADETVVRLPLDVDGLTGEARVQVADVVYSDADGGGPAAEDRGTTLRRAGGGS